MLQAEYEQGWEDGFEAAKKRIIAILKRFPLQTAAITRELESLHSSQPLTSLGETFDGHGN